MNHYQPRAPADALRLRTKAAGVKLNPNRLLPQVGNVASHIVAAQPATHTTSDEIQPPETFGFRLNVCADLRLEDLDHDQVNEIIVPLTDFYEFQDKMSISQIPLPDIVFKFDSRRGEYLPANPIFKQTLLEGFVDIDSSRITAEFEHRSKMLEAMTQLIYCGERDRAWRMFHRYYKLRDKGEIERRIKALLKTQPVYNFIYKTRNR